MNFDKIVKRQSTNSIKYDNIKEPFPKANENTIPLWVADMDFESSKAITSALLNRINHRIYGYSLSQDDFCKDKIIHWFKLKHNFEMKKEDLFFSPGILPGVAMFINALTDEGDSIIINKPVYPPFINMVLDNKRNLVSSNLINKNGYYEFDFEDFEKKILDNKVKIFILCSPHNPIGRVWKKDELIRLGKICIKHSVIVLSDEIHCDILRNGIKFTNIASLFEEENFITLNAPSKTFNIAGMCLANVIIKNDEYKKKWIEYSNKRFHIDNPNIFVRDLLIAAYSGSDDWYYYMLNYIDENFNILDEFIKTNLPKIKFLKPETSFLAWLDFREYNINYDKLSDLFVEKGNIALQNGKQFGDEGEGFFRMNIALPKETLKIALNNLKRVLDEL